MNRHVGSVLLSSATMLLAGLVGCAGGGGGGGGGGERGSCCLCSCSRTTAGSSCGASAVVHNPSTSGCDAVCGSACSSAGCPRVTSAVYESPCPDSTVLRAPDAGTAEPRGPVGEPQTLTTADETGDPFVLAVADGIAYWASKDTGRILRVAASGVAVEEVATGQASPVFVAVDDDYVYWTNGGTEGSGSVAKAPHAGGEVRTLADDQVSPSRLAVVGGQVYWCASSSRDPLSAGVLRSVSREGGAVTDLATTRGLAGDIAVWDGDVYWTDTDGLKRAPLDGGQPETLASASMGFGPLAIDAGTIYFAELAGHEVLSGSTDGFQAHTLAEVAGPLRRLAAGGGDLFWVSLGTRVDDRFEGARLSRRSPDGGTPEVVADGLTNAWSLAVDGGHVCWIASGQIHCAEL